MVPPRASARSTERGDSVSQKARGQGKTMRLRFSFEGGSELSEVAASVIERLGRDTGLHQEEARDLADATRLACERAACQSVAAELSAATRGLGVAVAISPGARSGAASVEARSTGSFRRRRA